ncbi:MAG: hypothetical protein ACFFCY_04700 [Promethearchaeota archaeon]
MNSLLKAYSLSEKAIMLYRHGLGKFPLTFGEIKIFIPNLSEDKIKEIIEESGCDTSAKRSQYPIATEGFKYTNRVHHVAARVSKCISIHV